MTIEYVSCSQSGTERRNPQCEALSGESVSRNASELDSASLHKLGVTNLPNRAKSTTIEEEIFKCIQLAPRGDWRQRAEKDNSRNLRDPNWSNQKEVGRLHISEEGPNKSGAKGGDCN